MKFGTILLISSTLFWLGSCTKEVMFSEIPSVEFDGFVKYADAAGEDTAVDFLFTLRDGDGDIGFRDNELDTSCGADNFNLYLFYEEKSDNTYRPKKLWQEVAVLSPSCDTLSKYYDSVQTQFSFRMVYIQPNTKNKNIEAEVRWRLDKSSSIPLLSEIGRFEFYIRDRAGNLSNKAYSEDLQLVR